MALILVPYAQKLVSDYLRDHPAIVALDGPPRVVAKTPGDMSTAWVRVTRLDASQNDIADHLTTFLMQFDCYAGDEGGIPEATLLGRTVRAVLGDIASHDHSGAVFTGCRITGDASVPDTSVDEPARDRTILTALLWGHAVSA